MAFTNPTSVSVGSVLTASRYNEDVVGNWNMFGAAWTSYTPTLTNCTAPITRAKYLKIGRWVQFDVMLTLTGAQVTGTVGISLPFASAAYQSLNNEGTGFVVHLLDQGSAIFIGAALYGTASRADLYAINATTTYSFLSGTSSTIPFTWANTDQIRLSGSYEATS